MVFKKYSKVVLILGLCAGVPAQGMSYLRYAADKTYNIYKKIRGRAPQEIVQNIKKNVQDSTCTFTNLQQDVHELLQRKDLSDSYLAGIFPVVAENQNVLKVFTDYVLTDWQILDVSPIGRRIFEYVRNIHINQKNEAELARFTDLAVSIARSNSSSNCFNLLDLLSCVDAHVLSITRRVRLLSEWPDRVYGTVFGLAIDANKNLFLKEMMSHVKISLGEVDDLFKFLNAEHLLRGTNEWAELFFPLVLNNLDIVYKDYIKYRAALKSTVLDYYLNSKFRIRIHNEILTKIIANSDLAHEFNFMGLAEYLSGECVSQTATHLCNNLFDYFREFVKNPLLKGMFEKVISLERDLNPEYYTFVHGQRSLYYFPERVYTFLWQLQKKRSLKDFFFPHIKDLVVAEQDIALEKVQRNFLLNNNHYDKNNRRMLLFMNYALFANAYNSGSNSAEYVLENVNGPLGTFELTCKEPFKIFGYEHIYHAFKNEIEELEQQYDKKCQHGNLLFIAIPKDKIHKYAYLAITGGKKTSMHIDGIGETSDIRIIMDNLLNHPERIKDTDKLEFCLIMTQKKGGLDPDTGIKIIPILSGDPAKLAELQKKEEALFSKIKEAIEEEEAAKAQAAAVARANAIVNHIVLPGKDAQHVVPAKTMARINNIMGHIQPQERN